MTGFSFEKEMDAPAKINLDLAVIGREYDSAGQYTGYHLIESRVHAIDLCDTLKMNLRLGAEVPCGENKKIRLVIEDERAGGARDRAEIPSDERNLMCKAARAFAEKQGGFAGLDWSLDIELIKRIPSGAGLGGGSADAAAVLAFLWEAVERIAPADLLHESAHSGARPPAAAPRPRLHYPELISLAASVGSDVPLFLEMRRNRAAAATVSGRGEIVAPAPASNFFVVLVKPPIEISAGEIYRALDESPGLEKAPAGGNSARAEFSDAECTKNGTNDLEKIAINRYPIIKEVIDFLQTASAQKAEQIMMSGSGPTIFALFDTREDAQDCYERVLPFCEEVILTEGCRDSRREFSNVE